MLSFVGQSWWTNSAGDFPTNIDIVANQYAAGTFTYAAASVPGPSVLILMGLGLIGVVGCKFRKTIKI